MQNQTSDFINVIKPSADTKKALSRPVSYFKNVSWSSNQTPADGDTVTQFDRRTGKLVPVMDLTQPFEPAIKNMSLTVPTVRYSELDDIINISSPTGLTPLDVLTAIYEFYQRPISPEQMGELIQMVKDDVVGDYTDAITNADAKMAQGKVVTRIEIMGSLTFFEGLTKLKGNIYNVDFGS